MSEALINKLTTVDLATIVAIIVLCSVVVNAVTPFFKKMKEHIIARYKKDMKREKMSTMVSEDHEKILQYEQNRVHDREQSFRIQKELTDAIKSINDRLDEIQENTKKQFEEMQKKTEEQFQESKEREEKRSRAQLKDRIGQAYRIFHSAGRWTTMEKEALEDLIAEYEAAGGMNSFVHSKVANEMYTWELIDTYDPSSIGQH